MTSRGPFRLREATLLALLVLSFFSILTYTARYSLNPDGVSYLDLAGVWGKGDWNRFVQGYWSPLYPALIGSFSRVTGITGRNLIPLAHVLNLVFLLGTVVIVASWARRVADPAFGRAAFAALLLCSSGPPRVEAVTPDLLLILVLTGATYELVAREGRRWLVTGLLLGTAFLVKTSIWPWLLIGAGVRIWGAARDRQARGSVLRSMAVTGAVMLIWIVPMSVKAGGFSLGSAARLNYCWYLTRCDSRIPDLHSGSHQAYEQVRLGSGEPITVARFDQAGSWTYQPWSDPTGWSQGIETQSLTPPSASRLAAYWLGLLARVFGRWLMPLLLAVLLPLALSCRWGGSWRGVGPGPTSAGAPIAVALGLLGLGQFVAIHAEPRLIAPFALMLALGAIHWLVDLRGRSPAVPPARSLVVWLGLVVGIGISGFRIRDGLEADERLRGTIHELAGAVARFSAAGVSMERITVVGPAMPVVATAYLVEGRIVSQVLPRSAEALYRLSAAERREVIGRVFAGQADVAWLVLPDGGVQFIPLGRPGLLP